MFFNTILKNMEVFVHSWYKFWNFTTAEILLLHLQQPMNCYFYHLTTVKTVTSSTQAPFTSILKMLSWPHGCSFAHFWTTHDFQRCCSLIIQSPYTSIIQQLIQINKMGFAQKTESHYELLQRTKFSILSLHINLSPEQHMTGCCAICCMLLLLGKVHTQLHLLQVPHTNVKLKNKIKHFVL